MVRIAIVDDEERIRLGLGKLITQLGEQFQVVASYASALEMLAEIAKLQADLVITDIKMPNISGLDLMERAGAARPDLKFAVLSGFDDFDYARQSLRNGAIEYLLKPVDMPELKRLLERVGADIQKGRDSRQLRIEDRLKLLLLNDPADLPAQTMGEAAKELSMIPLLQESFAVFMAKGPSGIPSDKWAVMAGSPLRERFVLKRDERTTAVIVAIGGRDHANTTKELGQTLPMRLPAAYRGRIGCSDVHAGPQSLRQAYLEAERAIEFAWYSEGKVLFQSFDGVPKRTEPTAPLLLLDKSFREALSAGDYAKAGDALRKWAAEMTVQRPSWREWLDGCTALALLTTARAASHSTHEGSAVGGPMQLAGPEEFSNVQEYVRYFLEKMDKRLQELKESRQEHRVVETVKAYIHRHYTEEMELNRLAEEVFLTPSYLSKLFKTETGETLTDYHISVRIERAKELLKESLFLKTYEVGEKVGYFDPAYFNKIFKKVVGCTPKEYRERAR
ncbi:response regulator transcription factor [Cohnella boryungensis]|uniref:Response regulator n=1 Tax=Cohnella boryungensis TaxID=768479 RepID=A0ABV8S9V3_9BACL